jgi:hypothetical protein
MYFQRNEDKKIGHETYKSCLWSLHPVMIGLAAILGASIFWKSLTGHGTF